jgi:hypothetical protein
MKYKDFYTHLLLENYQLADKLFFKTNKISESDQQFILSLTNKDFTTKTICDLFIENFERTNKLTPTEWKTIVKSLREYDKNVFPFYNFSFESPTKTVTIGQIVNRNEIIGIVNKFPSIGKRNLRGEIRIARNTSGFIQLKHTVEYIKSLLALLNNRSESDKKMIYNKIFNSTRISFDDIVNFLEEKENLLQGKAFNKEDLNKIIESSHGDLEKVYDVGQLVVVDVMSQSGIKQIGCNSLWCFTYGDEYGLAGEQWDKYSYNGHVYAIINFTEDVSSPEFIHILLRPIKVPQYPDKGQSEFDFAKNIDTDREYEEDDDSTALYDMSNQSVINPAQTIYSIARGDINIFDCFKFEEF